jgi:phosphatidate cytidylyltransferase
MPGGSGGLAPVLTDASAAAIRWGDLRTRVISAAILGPLALLCLWFGGTAFVLMIGIGAVGMALEWVRMCGEFPGEPAAIAVLAGIVVAIAACVDAHPLLGLVVLAVAAALSYGLSRAGGRTGIVAAGVPYIGLAAIALLWLREDADAGRADIVVLVLVVWASDIGAYLVGRLIGGPRLAPRISPGKTWSGAAGGLVGGCLCGWLVAHLFAVPSSAWHVVAVAALLGVVAQAGDLLESLIKRRFGVKDSGRTIPGHGGLLDRLDGLLTAAPLAALLALAVGRGVVLW